MLREIPQYDKDGHFNYINGFSHLLIELRLGEYHALTIAGCLDHFSLTGSSLKDSSSFFDAQDVTPTTFS